MVGPALAAGRRLSRLVVRLVLNLLARRWDTCSVGSFSSKDHAESLGWPLLNPDELLARQSLLSIRTSARRSETGDTQLGAYRKAVGCSSMEASPLPGPCWVGTIALR